MKGDPAIVDPAVFGTCPIPQSLYDRVLLGHGSGGGLTNDLIRKVFVPAFDNRTLAAMEDQATVDVSGMAGGARVAMTTDSFVVKPIFFPGGDIGRLAVHGTVNDLAVGGAPFGAASADVAVIPNAGQGKRFFLRGSDAASGAVGGGAVDLSAWTVGGHAGERHGVGCARPGFGEDVRAVAFSA